MLLSGPGAFSWKGCSAPSDARFRKKGEAGETGQEQAQSTEAGKGASLSNHPHGADDWILPGENEGATGPARPGRALPAHCKMHVSAFAEAASSWLQPHSHW